ncbi:MAG: hypothetical protein WDA72_04455 [Desulfomonilia bacterium]|nr:hypothetical protein [Desulfomonilia bacterium]HPX51476.1 hypothetical protein [Deltaproteobacteria bacterium]HQA72865.1 hypothetical protein [Deltaproteobacteria bacterium]
MRKSITISREHGYAAGPSRQESGPAYMNSEKRSTGLHGLTTNDLAY